MILEEFHNIPFRAQDLATVYPQNRDLLGVAKRLERSGNIIRLKKGLYVVAPHISHTELSDFLIANHLYGPSYISAESALRWYGLIPESVYKTISVTSGNARTYNNKTGTYRYIHAAPTYCAIGVTMQQEANASFMIATPEKALCDKIVFTPYLNLRYREETLRFLEEDLRFDMERFYKMDAELLRQCAEVSRKKTMINQLIKLIENERSI
ncbi:MAG: hypothetical protein J1D85_08465 [Bacteroidales bacterium]|nr:hypothetical protein [Bacteroidales bacterium]